MRIENEFEDWQDDEEEQPALRERLRLTTDMGQEPIRIDKFLMHRIENATRSKIQQAIDEGMVLVNGQPTKANYKIKAGEEIVVFDTRTVESTEIIPQEITLDIVYEDPDLMIINKPAGMVVHPGSGNYSGTLANGIAWHLNPAEDKTAINPLQRVGLVHRIDKNTSGLLLIAKNELSRQKLAAQFKAHTVHRRYQALAWGDFEQEEGTIKAHIGRNRRFRKKMDAFPDGDYGKEAITHYKVLERFHYTTLLEFRLETGRTHQIRVHSKLIGHPLFNDETYGGDKIIKGTVYAKYRQFVDNCFKTMPRQALHAKELGFIHPTTKKEMLFNSDLPEDFKAVLEKWRQYVEQYS
ncbi:MAG TPA: RluA family pseudouridine synthase [Edaphocola sp.]|nr:RluA family pseudouridine synthase [Edaphocola sp.]